MGSLHCFRQVHYFDSSVDHSVGNVAVEEDPKEELAWKFVVHVVPSSVLGYPSYLAEDVGLGVAASDVGSVRVT